MFNRHPHLHPPTSLDFPCSRFAVQHVIVESMNNYKKEKYTQALRKNKLLKDLGDEQISGFLGLMEEEIWPKHTCSIEKSLYQKKFHFVISGRLKIYKIDERTGREFSLFILKKGDAFDILCLLDGGEHAVFYEALDRAVLLSTPMPVMQQWLKDHPEVNRNMLPYLSQRMRVLEEYASNITLIDISTRLAKLILSHVNKESRQLELINDLSNEELANLIGSTRAVVNRHLQDFKNEGILDLGRQKVEIKNIELLLEKARVKGLHDSDNFNTM